ncbi:hypothetical protein gpAD87_20680 [Paenibacillus sp. AD87]|nr:hypothetical protein gpAD87_20680 [Paenibacillus sp. AD87]
MIPASVVRAKLLLLRCTSSEGGGRSRRSDFGIRFQPPRAVGKRNRRTRERQGPATPGASAVHQELAREKRPAMHLVGRVARAKRDPIDTEPHRWLGVGFSSASVEAKLLLLRCTSSVGGGRSRRSDFGIRFQPPRAVGKKKSEDKRATRPCHPRSVRGAPAK